MHHRDDQPAFVRQPLQGDFPRPPAAAVSRVWSPSSRRRPSRPLLHSLLTRENTIDRRLAERTGSGYTDPEAAFVARLTISSGFPTSMSDASELPGRRFASTRWSVVVAAGQRDSPESEAALATLCRLYWYPLYAYARRRLPSAEDADRKSTRLNSSHLGISYAVFCLKKK